MIRNARPSSLSVSGSTSPSDSSAPLSRQDTAPPSAPLRLQAKERTIGLLGTGFGDLLGDVIIALGLLILGVGDLGALIPVHGLRGIGVLQARSKAQATATAKGKVPVRTASYGRELHRS